jgi:hypothetical protein
MNNKAASNDDDLYSPRKGDPEEDEYDANEPAEPTFLENLKYKVIRAWCTLIKSPSLTHHSLI